MSQPVVGLPQDQVVYTLDLQLFSVQPEDTVNVCGTSPLEFDPVADVSDAHRIVASEDDFLLEDLDSMLKVPGGEEDVVFHQLVQVLVDVVSEILLPGHLQDVVAFPDLHCDVFFSVGIDIVVNLTTQFLQNWREVGAPPFVAGGEGEEDVERPYVFQLCYDFVFGALPILWSSFDFVEHCTRVLQLVGYLSVCSDSSPAFHASQVGVVSQPLRLHEGHGPEHVTWGLGEPVVDVEDSLLEVVLTGQFDFPFVVESKLPVRQERGPTLVVPVFLVKEAGGSLALSWSEV